MRMYDIILSKRNGNKLSNDEIAFVIKGYTNGSIPDYQMSALLMAIYFKGMDEEETANLTTHMAFSGDTVDLSTIDGIKVDKHSTGGVGDKTTLIIGPIVAACGGIVAKMSGRGLGHTGGTIDKLESIPNFQTSIEKEKFFEIVQNTGISVIGQTGNIAPADKKIYALRDVTATVDNISLIAASIMSKKIAAGSDAILLDVKTGSGAFMKTLDDSILLAREMVSIGENVGRKTVGLITNMDIPLGNAIGNSLEVIESVNTLKGNGPADLTEVCIELAANMLYLCQKGEIEQCRQMARKSIDDNSAFEKLLAMCKAQGGDISVLEDTNSFKKATITHDVLSQSDGFVEKINTESCGIASVILGAGRENKEDSIDFSAGIILCAKVGDKIQEGEKIATLFTNKKDSVKSAEDKLLSAYKVSNVQPEKQKLIFARVTKDDVIKY